jgi:L-fuconolactonase
VIDAHFHVWRLERADYGWLTPALGAIHRDVSLDDWRRVRAGSGITAGVLVQAAPTEAETRFLLDQARDATDVLGVVGWVDLIATDAAYRIRALAADSKLVGLRPMLQDLPDPDWILQDRLAPALEAVQAAGLTFDALIKPVHVPRVLALAARFPGLRIVVDHGAKPAIAAGQWDDWAAAMRDLAGMPQVFCKLSGLWTEAASGAPTAVLQPYMRHLLDCFGPQRLLWGSDWPVLELAGDYPAWHAAALSAVPPADRAQVFGATALQAYRIGSAPPG